MIGSVFLGDVQRHRLLSGSTPPSSPPPPSLSPSSTAAQPFPSEVYESPKQSPATIPPPPPPTIEPVQSLELRLRWLEALLYGVKPEKTVNHHRRGSPGTHDKAHGLKNGETLVRSTEELQRKLNAVVEGNDGLRRFMSHCAYRVFELVLLGHTAHTDFILQFYEQMSNMRACSRPHLPSPAPSPRRHRRTRTCLPASSKHSSPSWNPTSAPQIATCARSRCSKRKA